MSDLENLEALKRLLEHKEEEEKKGQLEKEKKFIADATRAFLGDTPTTGIQAYDPEQMMAFLSLPTSEVQERMGGDWATMEKMAFEAFTYTMRQKIQKSTSLLDWKG